MFSSLFSQIFKFFGVFFRTVRAFVTRRIVAISSRFRQLTNLSRSAARVAGTSVQAAASATQKPTKREDYVETGRLLIAKSLLIRIAILMILLGFFIYFVAWPFILSHFLTARFYEKDSRVENWSGRVIVYSDKKKQTPLYAGTLTKGVLSGQGRLYDENGVLSYEGALENGVPAGKGTEYSDGILHYEGQFSDGTYEGSGKLYEDGTLRYDGQFSEGKYEGRGSLYGDNGFLTYEGQFSGGLYEGRGTLYEDGVKTYEGDFGKGEASGSGTAYRRGAKWYEGQFAEGLPDGIGKEYEPDGRLRYEGGFSGGTYNGQGTLYPAQGQQLDAGFADGEPEGTVRWSKNGKLYYEGEWSGGAPSGYGALYSKAGQPLYRGQFLGGTLDGAWLLGLTADELREALGAGQTSSEKEDDHFYLIKSAGLGLVARCSYRTEREDSSVRAVYLYGPNDGGWARLLPGMDNVALNIWPKDAPVRGGTETVTYLPASIGLASGTYTYREATLAGGSVKVLSGARSGDAVAAIWSLQNIMPADSAGGKAGASDQTGDAKAVEEFLDALDGMEGTAGAGLNDGNPYYGGKSPAEPLGAAETAELTGRLLDAYVDYWLWAEKQSGYEEILTRTEVLLSEAKDAVSMGKGSGETVLALETEKLRLEGLIQSCETGRKQAELDAKRIVTGEPSDYDLSQVLLLFDPSELDLSQLSLTAMAWAQALGQTADAEAMELEVKSMLLGLEDAWNSVANARGRFENAARTAQTAAGDFAMGEADKTAWYNALSARTQVQIELYEALAAFTKQANALNRKTGGWLSRMYAWYETEFDFTVPEPEEGPEAVPQEQTSGAETGTEAESEAGTETETETEETGSVPAQVGGGPEAPQSGQEEEASQAEEMPQEGEPPATPPDAAQTPTPDDSAAADAAESGTDTFVSDDLGEVLGG